MNRERLVAAIHETGGRISNGRITGGNLSRVAEKLGVARKTLHNHMRALGLKGTSGRPKKKYSARGKGYAVAVVAAALVGGALLYGKRGTPT